MPGNPPHNPARARKRLELAAARALLRCGFSQHDVRGVVGLASATVARLARELRAAPADFPDTGKPAGPESAGADPPAGFRDDASPENRPSSPPRG